MKQFLSVRDVSSIDSLIQEALRYANDPFVDQLLGSRKRIGLLFLNPSLRTRISTQVAATHLGMDCIVFNVDKDGWKLEFNDQAIMDGDTVEHIKDAAPVLGSYFDILAVRTFPGLKDKGEDYSEQVIQQFVKYAGVPVVSLESATLHPLQSLADLITIETVLKETPIATKPKIVLTWAPHIKPLPQCVANSFAQWTTAWQSADVVITHPRGYELDESFTQGATIEYNQERALEGADFVYVKNWSSYEPYGKILCEDRNWMLTEDRMASTGLGHIMHCLPVRRNVELGADLLDGSRSLVKAQAANRVWAAQAVLASILHAQKNA